MATQTHIDLLSPAFKADPFPVCAELRRSAPISRTMLPDGMPVWIITHYDHAQAVLKDDRFSKDFRTALTPEQLAQLPPLPDVMLTLNNNMLALDPPDHTRLRALVSKAFTPRMVEQLRPRIQQIADELFDAVQDKGRMDLIAEFAFPLPIIVICEMLGIPHADRDQFRRWSNTLLTNQSAMQFEQEVIEAATAFVEYLRALVAERRAAPRADLVSALIAAEEQGDTLDEDELLSMIFILLIAGHETTVNLIGNGTLALLQHPDQLALLCADPSLLKNAVEELLRYTSPVETATERFAREDVQIGGVIIPKGEMVLVALASVNRDVQQFVEPDMLDVTRQNNRHLAFGHGIHYCLGAPLARLEGQIAFGTLLRRMPDLRLAVPVHDLQWRPGLVLRGLQQLPVAF